jgi:Ca2+-binding EF-hand superfamily protein
MSNRPKSLDAKKRSAQKEDPPAAASWQHAPVASTGLANVLSQKQVAELVDLFSVFDLRDGHSGGPGKMHCRDLRVAARILGVDMSREQLQSLTTLYSAEGQYFTQAEFIEIATELIISKPESEQKEAFLQSSFGLFDSHGSGVVTAKQLHRTLQQLNAAASACDAGLVDDLTEEDLEAMIRDLDKDGLGLSKANSG